MSNVSFSAKLFSHFHHSHYLQHLQMLYHMQMSHAERLTKISHKHRTFQKYHIVTKKITYGNLAAVLSTVRYTSST